VNVGGIHNSTSVTTSYCIHKHGPTEGWLLFWVADIIAHWSPILV